MRTFGILIFTLLFSPFREFPQESAGDAAGIVQDTLAGIQDTLAGQPDTLVWFEPGSWSDYLADTLPIAAFDTSYFSAGDPENNLIVASDYGQVEVVRMLVERGINVDAANGEGVTPLMYASQNGDTAIMAYLITHGADVNARPFNQVTPLIGATRRGHYDAVRLLLESGAEVDARDELDLTSLMHASAYDYPEIVELLIDAGASMEAGDWFGTRPLMMAAYYNCLEAADVLLRRGADPNGTDNAGFTPLMIAAQHGDYDLAWMLLDKGADPKLRNHGGHHALAIAVMKGDEDFVELLLESGASINQNINPSTNSLSLARESGNEEMVAYLVSNGARPNRRPELSEVRGGMVVNFNGNDFMLGFEAGVTENKYRMYLTSGFMSRLSPIRVLRPENDTLSYQLWERRYLWPVSLGRNFTLSTQDKNKFGFRVHLTGALTWGSYRGSDLDPGLKFMLVPGGGVFWRQKYFSISFDYQYMPIKVYDVSSHRFSLAFQGFYDFRSRIHYVRKDIRWF
jgi:ankyrin repeat protein